MGSPRAKAYSVLAYSGVLGVSLMVLSIMSLVAYGCGFDFRMSSVTYMLYLIYYRAGRCYSEVNWSVLDGLNRNITLQPNMPTETDAVFRTLIFSVVYLILSVFLVITTLLACFGIRRTGKSKHLIFWLYFAPFLVIFVSIIVMDLMTSGFYLFDYFSSLGVNGLMRLMEIRNTEEMRPILEKVSFSTRTMPPMIMFAAASKCVLFLILNIFIVFVFSSSAWSISNRNQAIIKVARKVERRDTPPLTPPLTPPPVVSSTMADVNLRVKRVEPHVDEVIEVKRCAPQPPYNPYMTNDEKFQETNF